MISVFFNCSSPYVGYTLRMADYKNKQMIKCSSDRMTGLGFKLFSVGGAYSILTDIEGKRYFHASEFESEAYDEQNRRIYTSIAFLADTESDKKAVNRIAMYEFFNTNEFYQKITSMITLVDTGFEVNYEMLENFINAFQSDIVLKTDKKSANDFFSEIINDSVRDKVKFVVLEASWNYLVKQVDDSSIGSAGRIFSLNDAKSMASCGDVILDSYESSGIEADDETTVAEPELKKPEASVEIKEPVKKTDTIDKRADELIQEDREIRKLRTLLADKDNEISRFAVAYDDSIIERKKLTMALEKANAKNKMLKVTAALSPVAVAVVSILVTWLAMR